MEALRGELAELPSRLTTANLRGDDAEEGRIRQRFSAIEGELPMIGERLEAARQELEGLPDPAAVRDAADAQVRALRDDLCDKSDEQARELGELLEERARLTGADFAAMRRSSLYSESRF